MARIDPTASDIKSFSGQHAGYEVISRLLSAFYYVTSRWPDAPRGNAPRSASDPIEGAEVCEVIGTCNFEFSDARGRTGPVVVSLPPGYAHKDRAALRYPVIYFLHGYGMTPEDLAGAITFLGAWMNGGLDSVSTRMAKAIVVYVDGRCRIGPEGKPECISGSFFTDSPRETGGKHESWFLDLMGEIDRRYRTMPESVVDAVE